MYPMSLPQIGTKNQWNGMSSRWEFGTWERGTDPGTPSCWLGLNLWGNSKPKTSTSIVCRQMKSECTHLRTWSIVSVGQGALVRTTTICPGFAVFLILRTIISKW